MLVGQMMDCPLTTTHFLDRARRLFPGVEIVTRQPDKSIARTTYGALVLRARKLAAALANVGVGPGDRVASLAWNHAAHHELYLGVPAMGAVLHTLNLRLHPDEIGYIARHASDKVVVVDACLLPLFEKFRAQVPSIEKIVVIGSDGPLADGYVDYEAFLASAGEVDAADWPQLAESSAAMICYTSGTTGNPKGVLYSHRSTVLHTLAGCLHDGLAIGQHDTVMPVVPMFHAAAWGLPFMATLTGAKMVYPNMHLDAASLLDLMEQEQVTFAGGVPTIWLGILALLDEHPKRWKLSLRNMIVGGAAAPPAMIEGFQRRHGIRVTHAWGMTEMSPLGTIAHVKSSLAGAGEAAQSSARASQGYPAPLVEQRHKGESGELLPWDGVQMGELEVRGPFVAASYFGGDGADRFTADGWFKTGDVVTIDAEGYVRITDRSKDVIKSGGEWISSVALENALMSHPAVLEAAVFAGQHEKWSERPIAVVVFKAGKTATEAELLAHIAPGFPKFWLPDAVLEVPSIPRTSTGKFLKTKLRELYGDRLMVKR